MRAYYDMQLINVIFLFYILKTLVLMKEILCDANVLYKAFLNTKKGSDWKESVQRYEINFLRNIIKTAGEIEDGTYKQGEFNEFILSDRGKTRDIKAVGIKDRVVLRALCDECLSKYLSNYLIYDNGASLKDKGIEFTRKRLEEHLHRYYRKHGHEGYVLLIDFRKFFDNVRHDKLMDLFRKMIDDEEMLKMIEMFISTFKIDVSYMSDDEYHNCMNMVFDSVKYTEIDERLLTGEKYMYKSLGIGSQISQISGLLYPMRIDNYCKIVKQCHYYGRYMDDIYIIHHDKQFLNGLLDDIRNICDECGLFIHEDKTHITKLSKGFTFLKFRYYLTETGKIIVKPSHQSVSKNRRKLKRFKVLYGEKKMSIYDCYNAYMCIRSNFEKCDSYITLKNLDKLFIDLFSKEIIKTVKRYGMKGFKKAYIIGLDLEKHDKKKKKRQKKGGDKDAGKAKKVTN